MPPDAPSVATKSEFVPRHSRGNGKIYERGESQTFYNEFFEVFDITRRRVASFEKPVKRLGEK
jgi:hypothetical protein